MEFVHENISCPPGVEPPSEYTTYANGGDLWPGRYIAPGSPLNSASNTYLNNVTVPTQTGFDFDKFLTEMGKVPPDCD